MPPETPAEALAGLLGVPRETLARLEAYVALLRHWQKSQNLVSARTLDAVWSRHIADSAQLVGLYPDARRWLDLGTGAGLPGLVVAILLADTPGAAVGLIESTQRKCAFLRAAIRETGAPAAVHCTRIESAVKQWAEPLDIVTARALAPLERLCLYVAPLVAKGAVAVFHKGREFETELQDASQSWDIDLVKHESRGGGWIVEIRDLQRRRDGEQ